MTICWFHRIAFEIVIVAVLHPTVTFPWPILPRVAWPVPLLADAVISVPPPLVPKMP